MARVITDPSYTFQNGRLEGRCLLALLIKTLLEAIWYDDSGHTPRSLFIVVRKKPADRVHRIAESVNVPILDILKRRQLLTLPLG